MIGVRHGHLRSGRVTGKLGAGDYKIKLYGCSLTLCGFRGVSKLSGNTPSGLRCDKHFIKQYCVIRRSSVPSTDIHIILA